MLWPLLAGIAMAVPSPSFHYKVATERMPARWQTGRGEGVSQGRDWQALSWPGKNPRLLFLESPVTPSTFFATTAPSSPLSCSVTEQLYWLGNESRGLQTKERYITNVETMCKSQGGVLEQ